MQKLFLVITMSMTALLLNNTSGTHAAGEKLGINSVVLQQKVFDPREAEKARLSFSPSRPAAAEVLIYTEWGEPVRSLSIGPLEEAPASVVWDGRDDQGNLVDEGVYFYVIKLSAGTETFTYNPFAKTHGRVLSLTNAVYDEKKGEIILTLPQAAKVRVRVNLKEGGPIMATPLEWEALPAGDHIVRWDGFDQNGLIDLSRHPKRNMMIFAYTLADNSIIVKGKTPYRRKKISFEDYMEQKAGMARSAEPFPKIGADRYIHARHHPRMCDSLSLDLDFPEAGENKGGVPVLKGKVPVRVTIDPQDQWIAENSRYELVFFIDTVVMFEDEAGFAPFTFYFDASGYPPGEHVITLNLLTYDDHYAVISKKVHIAEENE